jgi:hypothetical protein
MRHALRIGIGAGCMLALAGICLMHQGSRGSVLAQQGDEAASGGAWEKVSARLEALEKELNRKLDQILLNQAEILKDLHTVKVRASR